MKGGSATADPLSLAQPYGDKTFDMDPNANIKEQLELSNEILNVEHPSEVDANAAYRLAELVQALDGWLTGQGFLPKRWTHGEDKAG